MSGFLMDVYMKHEAALSHADTAFRDLLQMSPVLIGDAMPPTKYGVYAFSQKGEIIYVGEASGSGGLKARIVNKHVSGDEGHALQKEFQSLYPNRLERRNYIKQYIHVQWVEIPDSLLVSFVEKLAIAVIRPRLNKAVQDRKVS